MRFLAILPPTNCNLQYMRANISFEGTPKEFVTNNRSLTRVNMV